MNALDRKFHLHVNDNVRPRAGYQPGFFFVCLTAVAMWAGLLYGGYRLFTLFAG